MSYQSFASPLQVTLLQNLPDTAVLIFDENLRIRLAEGPEIYQWDYPTDKLVDMTLAEVFPAEHHAVFESLYQRALEGEEISKDCQLYDMYYRVKLILLPRENDDILLAAAIFQNVTMYEQFIVAISDQEYRYQALFEETNDAVFILDINGYHMDANQRAVEMFGYSLNEFVGMKYENIVAKDEFQHSTVILQGMLGGNVYPVYERTFIKKDGTRFVTEVNTALVHSVDGKPLYIQSVIRDITKRKTTEAQLRASEQRYRILTEMISDFAYAYSITETGSVEMEWVTEDSFQRITGYLPLEVQHNGQFSLWHPDDIPAIEAERERVIRGEDVTDEHRLVTKEGEVRWMQVYRRPVWDDQLKRVERFYGIAQDITDRKLAEDALRVSEERYRNLTELMSDYAFSFRLDDNLEMELEWLTGDSFLRLTGYNTAEAHQLKRNVLYHPDDRQQVDYDLQLVAHNKPVTGEYRIISKNGQERWLQIHRRPAWDDELQRVVRFYGVAQDITDRRLAEDALRIGEERYRSVTELISDYAFSINVDENLETSLEWITQESFLRVTGYNDLETRQLLHGGLYHVDDRGRSQNDMQKVLLGQTSTGEYRIITKDGRERWLQVHRRPVWDEKSRRIIRFYGVAQDITDRKLAEDALRLSEERYRNLTELISDYAFAIRVDEHLKMSVEWITQESFLRVTGYDHIEVFNLAGQSMFHPDDREQVKNDIERVLRGESVTNESRMITKSGEERWIQIHRRPVWDDQLQRVARYYAIGQDVTDRKLAEEALKRSEELLNQTQQIARIGGWEYYPAAHQMIWTKQTREIHEVGDDYKPVLESSIAFYAPDSIPLITQAVEDSLQGTPFDLELGLITATGKHMWVRAIAHVDEQDGKVLRIFGTFQDITQRREAEMRLRESEERYRTITDLISDYAFSVRVPEAGSNEVTFEWITEDSLTRITGYTFEEFKNLSIMHSDDYQQTMREMHAVTQGQTNSSTFRILTKWGDTRWLRLDRYPVWDDEFKKVIRFYGIAHDITEIKQAEDAQRRSEERFRLISQSTLDGLYDIDMSANQTWLSDGYMRLFNLTEIPTDVIGWWLSRIHADDQDEVRQKLSRLIDGNISRWSAEYRIYGSNGKLIFITDRGYIIPDETGKAERMIGAVTDVTQQREVEQRKLEVAVEREKLHIFTDFITAISHDFRNPLSILNTSIYLLQKVSDPENQQRHIAKLKHEIAHIEVLVEGLLTMSQLGSPEQFNFSPLNVNELLHYVEVREQSKFEESDLRLEIQPADDLPLVQADLNWLYRALRNLISNAHLYTPEGGEVTVSTYQTEDEVVIQVEDTGIGIPPEHLDRIFDPLYRVQSHRPSSGQGLGLSIVRKIVERHEGHITVESLVDHGSIFRIHLPVPASQTDSWLD